MCVRKIWSSTVPCFPAACVIPLTVPQTVLIKDDWSWGPGSIGAELPNHVANPVYHPHTSFSVQSLT